MKRALLAALLALVLAGLTVAVLQAHSRVRADANLDARRSARAHGIDVAGDLRGLKLGTHVSLLEDKTGELTLSDVRAAAQTSRFRAGGRDSFAFGFTNSTYWVRLAVDNSASMERSWLLEVGFPHLDHVTFYAETEPGRYQVRQAGDMVPFAERDLSYRNIVFMLEQPPHVQKTYYLRVASRGVLNLPLRAWSLEQFAAHQHLDWAGLCVFYGIILMMACYNLSLYAFTRDREYAHFVVFVLAMGVFQMTVVGHTFQYLLPNQSALAQLAVPLSIVLCMLCTLRLGRHQLRAVSSAARALRLMDWLIRASTVVLLLTPITPFHFSIRFVPVFCFASSLVSFSVLWRVMQTGASRSRLYVWGWTSMLIGALVALAGTTGLLPESFFTQWAAQLGASVQFVLVSAAMAAKLTWLRAELRRANEQLVHKLFALEHAVTRAELATVRAERALRVKDEFMATMSHELRTPLNTIINVPQGLVEDFPLRRFAVCSGCQSQFELDPGERISSASRCPDCHARATLQLHERASYTGQPAAMTRYLETIERSGKHLLQVVNGILRTERAELADSELSYAIVEVGQLVRDVVDEMRDWAVRSGVVLMVHGLPRELELAVDPLRIRQVLINLIGNAIKFSNGRGTVTVSIRELADSCALAVQDQGIGIASDKLTAVFDSYQQVHDSDTSYGGTGLGLSISRALVERHGGELRVESELGRGATFTFTIPRTELAQRRSA